MGQDIGLFGRTAWQRQEHKTGHGDARSLREMVRGLERSVELATGVMEGQGRQWVGRVLGR